MKFTNAIEIFAQSSITVTDVNSLRKAYKSLALSAHPDRIGEPELSMVELNAAWSVIQKHSEKAIAALASVPSRPQEKDLVNGELPGPSLSSIDELIGRFCTVLTEDVSITSLVGEGDFYLQDKDKVLCFNSYTNDSFSVTDITKALDRKSICTRYSFNGARYSFALIDYIENKEEERSGPVTLRKLWNMCEAMDFEPNGDWYKSNTFEFSNETIQVSKRDINALRVFSPFKLNKFKRLKELPKKMNRNVLYRLLANGQFREFKQDFYYTDDYALDNAMDFRKGLKSNPIEELSKYIEDAGPHHLWVNGKRIHLGNHSNDGNSLTVDILNEYPVINLINEDLKELEDINN